MSRVSDTRLRTRQAAAKLVASGRRPHDLTVDLIYAEIRQGSRTTINDELKLWKDEQAKVDALSAALPAPVANAMRAAWAVAVEHGESVFDQRREEVEAELAEASNRAETAEAVQAGLRAEVAASSAQLEGVRTELATARQELHAERESKDTALLRAAHAEEQTSAERAKAQQRIDALRQDHEQRLQQLRESLASKEQELRAELARATERLEGVQKHVMLQVSQAREAQKRAEDQLAKATQRIERLASELEPLRVQVTTLTTQLQRATQDHTAAASEAKQLQTERDELKVQLANAAGRLEAAAQQVSELMARVGASAVSKAKAPRLRRAGGTAPTTPE